MAKLTELEASVTRSEILGFLGVETLEMGKRLGMQFKTRHNPDTEKYLVLKANGTWQNYLLLDFTHVFKENRVASPFVCCREFKPDEVTEDFRESLRQFCSRMFGCSVIFVHS